MTTELSRGRTCSMINAAASGFQVGPVPSRCLFWVQCLW